MSHASRSFGRFRKVLIVVAIGGSYHAVFGCINSVSIGANARSGATAYVVDKALS